MVLSIRMHFFIGQLPVVSSDCNGIMYIELNMGKFPWILILPLLMVRRRTAKDRWASGYVEA